MDYGDYITKETSALVSGLLAAQSEVSTHHLLVVRQALEAAAAAIQAAGSKAPQGERPVQEFITRLQTESQAVLDRVQREAEAAVRTANQEVQSQRALYEELAASLVDVQAQAESLRSELRVQIERADAADQDCAASLEANRRLEAARLELEVTSREQEQARETLERDLRAAREQLQAAERDQVRTREALQDARTQAAALAERLEGASANGASLQARLDGALQELEASAAREAALAVELETWRTAEQEAVERSLAAENALAAVRAAVGTLEAETASLRGEHATLVEQVEDRTAETRRHQEDSTAMAALIDAASEAFGDLAAATTMADVLTRLVPQFGRRFPRTALFRVTPSHLHGEHHLGFEPSSDVSKLLIPMNVDSLITRAARSRAIESRAAGDRDDRLRGPFGQSAAAALALPLVVQEAPLAVIYVETDDEPAIESASRAYATLLCRHAAALLGRLTQELKTLSELREYAATLLQEAEQMHGADSESRMGPDEVRRRLQDTVDCARQLFAQRAAMEGPAAAALLEERIAATIDARGDTVFAADLAIVTGRADTRARTAAS